VDDEDAMDKVALRVGGKPIGPHFSYPIREWGSRCDCFSYHVSLATVDPPNKDLPYEKHKCPVHFQRLQEEQESDSSLIKSFKEKHARKLSRRNLPNLPTAMRQWRLQQARELQAIDSEETDYRGDCFPSAEIQ
jgi:hypothetical protein